MFFRGKQPEASIWRRFRASTDGFTFTESDGVYTAHIVANAERVVDLMWTMTELLSPAVDLFIDDLRSGRKWRGESLPLPDVRDTIARLKAYEAARAGPAARVVRTNREHPPDFINIKVEELVGDRPFDDLDKYITQDELRALSENYKRVAGFALTDVSGR